MHRRRRSLRSTIRVAPGAALAVALVRLAFEIRRGPQAGPAGVTG
jgi:hypothetical protein